MRTILCCLALVFGPVSGLKAQVSLDVLLDQEQYLRDESLPVKVRLTNLSGQTLHLGKEEDWLTFSIESKDGFVVRRLAQPPVAGEFELESSLSATKRVDVMPCFGLSRPGRYTVTASVRIRQWNQEWVTHPRSFDIIAGTTLWEREFGVPATNALPEVRKYSLVQAQALRQMRLYVRTTDPAEAKVFAVIPIGPLVSFSKPESQLDKTSRLHVLFQTGPRSFKYSIVSPDGELVVRQTYDYTGGSRPILRAGSEGQILVTGGVRRMTSADLPTLLPVSTNEVSTNETKLPRL
jgi:hypothetical protein